MESDKIDKPKHAGGRPKKEKRGEMLWIPCEAIDVVKAVLHTVKTKNKKTKGESNEGMPSTQSP